MDDIEAVLREALAAKKRETLENMTFVLADAARTLFVYNERVLAILIIECAAAVSAAAEAGPTPPGVTPPDQAK